MTQFEIRMHHPPIAKVWQDLDYVFIRQQHPHGIIFAIDPTYSFSLAVFLWRSSNS